MEWRRTDEELKVRTLHSPRQFSLFITQQATINSTSSKNNHPTCRMFFVLSGPYSTFFFFCLSASNASFIDRNENALVFLLIACVCFSATTYILFGLKYFYCWIMSNKQEKTYLRAFSSSLWHDKQKLAEVPSFSFLGMFKYLALWVAVIGRSWKFRWSTRTNQKYCSIFNFD